MRNKLTIVIILLSLLCFGGYFILNKISSKIGYDGAYDIVSTIGGNYSQSKRKSDKSLELIFSEKGFDKIKARREAALKRGLIVNDGDSYVKVKLVFNKDTLSGQARLKGHMTDHLEGKKWSYRIKLDGDQRFLGMKRFTMQHPGTRNYLYEWVFHEMLKQEEIIALQYDFMHVTINGGMVGVYAIEEHFAEELLDRNERPQGAIMRFNPNLYWVGRENFDLFHLRIPNEYAKYHTSFLEPYDRGRVQKDTVLLNNFLQGQLLVEKFRAGVLKTSQVFDVEKMAAYHAINDLVGGYHSLDWSDVKYYYNPKSNKVEPVGYESFSVRPIRQLAGSYQFRDNPLSANNFHVLLFSDEEFFAAYLKAVKRLSERSYINDFISSINDSLSLKMQTVYSEFPYKNFDTKGYEKNQRTMEKSLSIPKAFHCYSDHIENDELFIKLAALTDLPVIISGIKIKDKIQPLHFVLSSKLKSARINYADYKISLSKKLLKELSKDDAEIKLIWTLPGLDQENQTILFGDKNLFLNEQKKDTIIEISENSKIHQGLNLINVNTTLENDDTFISGNIQIKIEDNIVFQLIDNQDFIGTEERPIIISGKNNSRIHLIGHNKLKFEYCVFNDVTIDFDSTLVSTINCVFNNSSISTRNSKIVGKSCLFENSTITSSRGNLTLSNSSFVDTKRGIKNSKGSTVLNNVRFLNAKESVCSNLGSVDLRNVTCSSSKEEAFHFIDTYEQIENCKFDVAMKLDFE